MDEFIKQLNSEFDAESIFDKIYELSHKNQKDKGFTILVQEYIFQTLKEAHNISVQNIEKYHKWLLDNYSLVPKHSDND